MLAPLGRLIVYGVSSVARGRRRHWWHAAAAMLQLRKFSPLSLMNRNRGVFGLNLAHLWDEREQLAAEFRPILQGLEAGRLQPIIARTFPLARAADAHEYLQSRASIGKVLLTIEPS
jgi:NADPH:quinone reductase-like Zn-dependent oxidoreductase